MLLLTQQVLGPWQYRHTRTHTGAHAHTYTRVRVHTHIHRAHGHTRARAHTQVRTCTHTCAAGMWACWNSPCFSGDRRSLAAVLITFRVVLSNSLIKSNSRAYFGSGLRAGVIIAGELWRLEWEAAGHVAFTVGKQRVDTHSQLHFHSGWSPGPGDPAVPSRAGSSVFS